MFTWVLYKATICIVSESSWVPREQVKSKLLIEFSVPLQARSTPCIILTTGNGSRHKKFTHWSHGVRVPHWQQEVDDSYIQITNNVCYSICSIIVNMLATKINLVRLSTPGLCRREHVDVLESFAGKLPCCLHWVGNVDCRRNHPYFVTETV